MIQSHHSTVLGSLRKIFQYRFETPRNPRGPALVVTSQYFNDMYYLSQDFNERRHHLEENLRPNEKGYSLQ